MTFDQFAHKYRDKFRSIARATRGEVDPDEVQNEAWVQAAHWAYGDNPATDVHPLLNKLSVAQDAQPLEHLLAREEAGALPTEPGVHHTRASAYLVLVRRYRHCMRDIANHLLISLSYCYYRLNEARELAERQYALPDTLEQVEPDFTPGPWRSYQLYRPWVQLELDLELSCDLLSKPGAARCL